jgi:hypothetical protein
VGVVGRFRAGEGGGRYSETNMMTGGEGMGSVLQFRPPAVRGPSHSPCH